MTTQQAQEVVKAVYPLAMPYQSFSEKWAIVGNKGYLSGFEFTQSAAWLSAASKITGKTIQP